MLGAAGAMAYPWTIGFAEALAGVSLANSVRGRFTIPQLLEGATFHVWCASRTAGNIDVKLRFGFNDADADISTLGVDFRNLALTNETDYRSQLWTSGAAAPNTVGNTPAFLPPRVTVIVTTGAGTTIEYVVSYGGVGLW